MSSLRPPISFFNCPRIYLREILYCSVNTKRDRHGARENHHMTFVLVDNLHTELILMERVTKKTVRERERETRRRGAGTQ